LERDQKAKEVHRTRKITKDKIKFWAGLLKMSKKKGEKKSYTIATSGAMLTAPLT